MWILDVLFFRSRSCIILTNITPSGAGRQMSGSTRRYRPYTVPGSRRLRLFGPAPSVAMAGSEPSGTFGDHLGHWVGGTGLPFYDAERLHWRPV